MPYSERLLRQHQGETSSSRRRPEESQGFIPATVIDRPAKSAAQLSNTFKEFATLDDVYAAAASNFSNTIVLASSSDESCSSSINVMAQDTSSPSCYSTETALAPGPYFLYGAKIHQAWKLYEDYLDSFMITTTPDDPLQPHK